MKLNLYNFLSVCIPLVTIETKGEVENIAKYAYHGYPEDRKMGKAWEHSLREWTGGGRRGEGPIFKYIFTKLESEFLTSQDE